MHLSATGEESGEIIGGGAFNGRLEVSGGEYHLIRGVLISHGPQGPPRIRLVPTPFCSRLGRLLPMRVQQLRDIQRAQDRHTSESLIRGTIKHV